MRGKPGHPFKRKLDLRFATAWKLMLSFHRRQVKILFQLTGEPAD